MSITSALPYAAGGMGLLGLIKGLTLDKDTERRDRRLAAETQRLSPWTGLKANEVREANPIGQALQFGSAGLSAAAGIQNAASSAKLSDAMTGYYERGGMGSTANDYAPVAGAINPEAEEARKRLFGGWFTGSTGGYGK